MPAAFLESEFFTWVVLPFLIFFSRVLDVSIGTLRILFMTRGKKLLAPMLGFFELLIWLIAIGQVMQNLTNAFYYIVYAAGFSAGTLIGMMIEEKLAIGIIIIRIITRKEAVALIRELKATGHSITSVEATGNRGKVSVLYTIVKRGDIKNVVGMIKRNNPNAFYSIEDVKFATENLLPLKKNYPGKRGFNFPRVRRKGK